MPFYPKRRPARKPSRRPRKATRKGVTPAVKKYVKRTLHNNIENKQWINPTLNQSVATATTGVPPAFTNLIPVLSQGVQQSNCVGNEIKPVKAVIKGRINLLPYNATSNPYAPVMVKMWLVSYKTYSSNLFSSTNYDNFFQQNNSTAAFQGNLLDLDLPVNKDLFTIYSSRTFELGVTAQSGSYGGGVSATAPDNSKVSRAFYFDYTKHLKSKIKYNDSTTVSTNRNMFLIFQAVSFDGQTWSNDKVPVEYHQTTVVTYEDA